MAKKSKKKEFKKEVLLVVLGIVIISGLFFLFGRAYYHRTMVVEDVDSGDTTQSIEKPTSAPDGFKGPTTPPVVTQPTEPPPRALPRDPQPIPSQSE